MTGRGGWASVAPMHSSASIDPSPRPVDTGVELTLENFGPLVTAQVALKPLTVLVGPNNSGKSCASMMLWVLHHAASVWSTSLRRSAADAIDRLMHSSIDEATQVEWPSSESFVVPLFGRFADLLKPSANEPANDAALLEAILAHRFGQTMQRVFSTEHAPRLVRQGGDSAAVVLRSARAACRFSLEAPAKPHSIRATQVAPPLSAAYLREMAVAREAGAAVPPFPLLRSANIAATLGPLARPAFYLPAARSGYFRVRRLLTAEVLQSTSAHVGMAHLDQTFLAHLVSIDPHRRGPLADLADEIEALLLDGRIVAIPQAFGFADFRYEHNGLSLPVERMSSGVSELAPLILFVRHLLAVGDTLILEEPEAHLHPALQRKVARALARLVRAGINVVATTHSDVIVEQFEHLVRRSAVAGDDAAGRLPPADAALQPAEVAVHVVRPVEGGFAMSRVPVTIEDGIETDDLSAAHLALYEELVALDDALSRADGTE